MQKEEVCLCFGGECFLFFLWPPWKDKTALKTFLVLAGDICILDTQIDTRIQRVFLVNFKLFSKDWKLKVISVRVAKRVFHH